MTTNHTFGTWRTAAGIVDNPRVIVEDETGLAVCALSLRGALGDLDRMNARARLIAAAPELLAALEKEAEWRGREADGAIDPEWDYETMVGQYRRAAIAKAKGEQA